jgi:hypothetical protein
MKTAIKMSNKDGASPINKIQLYLLFTTVNYKCNKIICHIIYIPLSCNEQSSSNIYFYDCKLQL